MSSGRFLFPYKYLNNQLFKVDTFSGDYYNLWIYINSVFKESEWDNGKSN